MKVFRYLIQVILFGLFMASIAVFSRSPVYQVTPEQHAIIKLTIKHAGQLIGQCRPLTAEEKSKLAPNMRITEICPRERSPLKVQLQLDDKSLYESSLFPTGIHNDGATSTYVRFIVPSGTYRLKAKLNDRADSEEYNYKLEEKITLKDAQVLVIDFRTDSGGFVIQ